MRKPNFLILLIVIVMSAPLHAATQRTFVASDGLDSNPCSRTLPCRNFAAAITQTLPNGEVVALDSAGYGPIAMISQPVAIIAPPGVHAAITASSGTAITISVAGGSVLLRNLFISGLGATTGIWVQDAASVAMNHLYVTGFVGGYGVFSLPNTGFELTVEDSIFRRNGDGMRVGATTGLMHVAVSRSTFADSPGSGLLFLLRSRVVVTDTLAVGNGSGFFASTSASGQSTHVTLEGCTATNNTIGIKAFSDQASVTVMRVSNCTISGNTTGLESTVPANIQTRGNNTLVDSEVSDGVFNSSFSAQ